MTLDKTKNNLNVPPLRFPGFTEEWEKIKVSDLLNFYSTNSLSWEMLNYEGGDFLNLHYGLIHSGLPTLIDLKKDILPFVNENALPKKYSLCKEGDVAFADASEDTNDVAKAVEFINLDGQQVISGLHTIHGRDNENKTVLGFKGYAFASSAFHNQIRRIAQGTKIYSISSKSFDEVFIGVPTKAEQIKIARLLHLIDERITTQNKIIDNLQSLIKGLAKALTHQGEANTRISDCLTCHTSTLQEGALNQSGEFPVYGASGIAGFLDDYRCDEDSILVIKDGSGAGTVSYATGEYSVIGTLNYLTAQPEYSLKYLYFCLMSFNFEPFKTGMAIPHIYFKDYGRAKIYCPSYSEQMKIATFISAYENKLHIEKSILSNLILHKQYHLMNLFI